MKKWIFFFLYSLFLCASASGTQQKGVSVLEKEVSQLISLKNLYTLIHKTNLKRNEIYLKCLESEGQDIDVSFLSYKEDSLRFVEYHKSVSCQKINSFIFSNKSKQNYRTMRIAMALMSPQRASDSLQQFSQPNPSLNRPKVKREIKHFIRTDELDKLTVEPLSQEETSIALSLYSEEMKFYSAQYQQSVFPLKMKDYGLKESEKDEVYASFLDPTKFRLPKRFEKYNQAKLILKYIMNDYYSWMEVKRYELHEGYKKTYLSMLDYNPNFLYLKSSSLKKDETIDSFKKTKKNALKNLEILKKDTPLENINKFQDGFLNNSQLKELKEDLIDFLSDKVDLDFSTFFKLASELKSKASKEELEMYKTLEEELKNEVSYKEKIHLAKEFSSVVLCFVPKVRILSLITLKTKSLCFGGSAWAISYALHNQYTIYTRSFQSFFASPSGDHLLKNFSQLEEDYQDMLITGIFLLTLPVFFIY